MNNKTILASVLASGITAHSYAAPLTWDFSWDISFVGTGLPFQTSDTVNGALTFESTTPDTGV